MATYFTGTSTGNRYEVGQRYEMNGTAYTANRDGSFTADRREVIRDSTGAYVGVAESRGGGQTLQGSAGNPDVSWYASAGTRTARGADYTAGESIGNAANGRSSSGGGRSQAAQPARNAGAGVVPIANRSVGSTYRPSTAARVAAAGGGFGAGGPLMPWRGMDDPEQHFKVMGHQMVASPRSSNAALIEERWGDAEFLSPGWFANWGVAIDDYNHNQNLRVYGTENTYDPEHRAAVRAGYAEDLVKGFIANTRSAIPADVRETRHDGWVSFDDGQSWQFDGAAGKAFQADKGRGNKWYETTFPGTN